MRRDLGGHVRRRAPRAARISSTAPAVETCATWRWAPVELGEREVARHQTASAAAGIAGEPEARRRPAPRSCTPSPTSVAVLGVRDHRRAEEPRVLERAAHDARSMIGLAVVAERDDAGAPRARRSRSAARPRGPAVAARSGRRAPASPARARSRMKCVTAGRRSPGWCSPCRRRRVKPPAAAARAARGDVSLYSWPGSRRCDVHVDEAGRDPAARGVDALGARRRRGSAPTAAMRPSSISTSSTRVELRAGIEHAPAADPDPAHDAPLPRRGAPGRGRRSR